MTDIEKKDGIPGTDEEIARLLRLAGPRPAADPAREERVRSAVHARWRSEVRGRGRHFIRWIALPAAAAAAVAAVTVATLLFSGRLQRPLPGAADQPSAVLERAEGTLHRGDGRSLTAGAELQPGTEILTGTGGRASLRLSGGTTLRLDSGTTLGLLSGTLLVLKQGAVYLDTGGTRGAAVTVRTPAGTVRDVGTQFLVRIGDAGLVIAVREGTASLAKKEGGMEEIPAGIRLAANGRGEVARESVPSSGPDWEWILAIAPPLPLENRTLGEFLAWVSRETGRQIRFSDPARAQERAAVILHGSLEGLRPDEAPAAILPTCGLTSHLEGEVLVIDAMDPSAGTP
jgi:ferric-dicitrate binding protein FerR (iron transport regulator)